MAEAKGTSNRLLTLLVTVLVVVACVQSYALFRLHKRLNEASDERATAVIARSPARPGIAAKTRDRAPKSREPAQETWPDLLPHDWLAEPFDPDNWNPFEEMRRMRERIDRMFRDAFERFQISPRFGSLSGGISFSPSMDLREEKDRYIVRFDLPGVDKSDIEVRLEDRKLTVSGSREERIERREEGGRIWRRELRTGRFQRSVLLPGPVDPNGMKAHYEDGVLIVTIPKAKKPHITKRIEVR